MNPISSSSSSSGGIKAPGSTPFFLWIQAVRVKTLPAGAAPVILGLALAYRLQPSSFAAQPALATLACVLLLQMSANLINDYFDAVRGVDGPERLGPTRVTASGLISPQKVQQVFRLFLAIAFGLGIYLSLQGGIAIFAVGLLAMVTAYAYTGGPYPLSHFGLGELLAFVFFGPVAVGGTFYIQAQSLPWPVLLASCGPGFISATIMGINNLRDRQTDLQRSKVTLMGRVSPATGRKLILGFITLASATPVLFYFLASRFPPIVIPNRALLLAGLAFLPFLSVWRGIASGPITMEFNQFLAKTGAFLLLYTAFFALGIF
jgi:1,4-dihydroxy-2-naphthoate octaprenyltransferase